MEENAYDYFMVAISIVTGLALGTLLTKSFTLYNIRDSVKFDWVTAAWALGILLWIVQFWYVGWIVYEFEGWRFSVFLLLLLAMISIYGAAELILPAADQPNPDMLEHFHKTGPAALVLFAAYFALAFPLNLYVLGSIEFNRMTVWEAAELPVTGGGIILAAAWLRGERIRQILALAFLGYTLYLYAGILFVES